MTKTADVEDLRREYERGNRRVVELVQEQRNLPAKIKEAARQEARVRGRAARSGEDVSAAAGSDLLKLREREAVVPLELWGAKISRLEATMELHKAEVEQVSRLAVEARAAHEAAEQRLKEAQADYDAARDRHWSLSTRAQNLQTQTRRERQELQALEANPPDA